MYVDRRSKMGERENMSMCVTSLWMWPVNVSCALLAILNIAVEVFIN